MIFLLPGVVFLIAVFLLPLLGIVFTSVSGPAGLTIQFYVQLLTTPLYRRVLATTI